MQSTDDAHALSEVQSLVSKHCWQAGALAGEGTPYSMPPHVRPHSRWHFPAAQALSAGKPIAAPKE
jgi:hypothetical protein